VRFWSAPTLDDAKHSIITGPRQTGKTTLLRQLQSHCETLRLPNIFIDLEHRDVLSELDEDPQNLFRYCPEHEGRMYVFIDEVQKLKYPSNFLKQIYDDHKSAGDVKIVATGSSAFYIDRKFNDSLAGRKKIFNLYTCTFSEYLLLSGKEELREELVRIQGDENAKSLVLSQLSNEFLRYMQYGGYPEVVTEKDERGKVEILRDLRDSFVKKDIEESGVNDSDAFFRLFQLLAVQSGGLVNVSELSKTLRMKDETVSRYMDVMAKCFHIAQVRPFHKNLEKELVKMPRCYFLDSGMRNSLMNNFLPFNINPDAGHVWENQVFRILVDGFGVESLRFWRTSDDKEVDFVIPDGNPPLAVEVKKNSHAAALSKYKTFTSSYPDIKLTFACLEPFGESLLRFIGSKV